MTPEEHERFTRRLVAGVEADSRVLGVVGLGSTAAAQPAPDRWSDHDVWLVVQDGAQERFRTDVSWLPDADQIAWWHRETEHGLGVVYRSGHLVECAVFATHELAVARANRARVLLDRDGIAEHIAALQARTAGSTAAERPGTRWLFGQLLVGLVVASSRWARGERLSAQRRILDAVGHLAQLLAAELPSAESHLLDDLDPLRRVERVWPAVGAELDRAVLLPAPAAAGQLVATVRSALAPLPAAHLEALAVVARLAAAAATARPG
ncbi:MAG TPA: hypothetical protein VK698_24205 [Kofleriaceae bacterium]|nr:hypothetical protein [Kofleriaceae bacterium]